MGTVEAIQSRAPNAVVTGAAGWLGQNLVRGLLGQRQRIRCLVQSPEEAPYLELLDPKIEVVVGDVRDPVAFDRLFDGAGEASVFHAAAVIHPQRHTRELFDVNVGGTQLALDRARRASAGRFVHVSSNSPFGANPTPEDRFTEESPYNPYLAYGRSKMEAEQLVQRSHERGDVPSVVVRVPWFYGPHQPARQTRFFAAIRRGRFPLVGDGRQRRSMAYTGNLVDGLLRAEAVEAAAAGPTGSPTPSPTSCGRSSPPCAGPSRPRACRCQEASARSRSPHRRRRPGWTGSHKLAASTSRRCTSSGS